MKAQAFKPFPVGTVRGPYVVGWGNNPRGGVSFMVQGPGGWVPFNRKRSEESEAEAAARKYAKQITP